MRRVGYLEFGSAAPGTPLVEAFRRGLRDSAGSRARTLPLSPVRRGKLDQLPEFAVELVHRKVDLIFASTTPAALAAKQATTTIPIVIGFVADPVGEWTRLSPGAARGATSRAGHTWQVWS